MARRYIVQTAGSTVFSLEDNASPYIAYLTNAFPNYADRALRHTAWWLRGVIKSEMKAGAPGGQRWAKTAGITRYRVITAFKRSGRAGDYSVLKRPGKRKGQQVRDSFYPEAGRLVNAVGYQHKSMLNVAVGWLSKSAVRLGIKFQGGQKTPVTNKMRLLFMAAGVPLAAGKRMIEQPARPVFVPIYTARKQQIKQVLEDRIMYHVEKLSLGYGAARAA